MQKAEWNSQLIYAFDIEKGSEQWEKVRHASENGELRCPDPNCQNRTLKYRCGDLRIPHFAHKVNRDCDYAQFDAKNSELIKKLQQKLYDKYCKLNFTVLPDEKIGNYYVHLIICSDINEKTAIRIVDENLPSISEIESIYQACENENIKLQWIIIGDPQQNIRLEQTRTIKRYVLEHGDDLLITDQSFSVISQYRCNKPISIDIFKDTAPFDELTIESGHLSLPGFSQKYRQQLIDKQKVFREQKEWSQKAKREEDAARRKNTKWPTTSQNISPVNSEPTTMKPTGTSFCPDASLPLPQRYLAAKAALFERAFSSLNPRQQEAVFHVNGPLLVRAGAGSGKTTVLVRRIAFLIRYGNAYHSERLPEPLTEAAVSRLEQAASLSPGELLPLLNEFADDPCPPWRVLAITFTNKAANEIKTRLAGMFPEQPGYADEIWTGTFHSVCVRILRRHGEACGYRPGFSIYDADDSKKAFSEAMKRAGAKIIITYHALDMAAWLREDA